MNSDTNSTSITFHCLVSLGILSIFIVFFHIISQWFLNLNEFIKRQEHAGNRYPKTIFLASLDVIIVAILFAGWQIFKPESHVPNVWSLQDNWELLISRGHDWRSDAYPNRITFDVNESMPYKIEVRYLSKSAPDKRYYFDVPKYDSSNTGEEEFDPSSSRENAKLEIKREDWVIDSTQAWNLFLKNETISTCATPRDKHVTIYMGLSSRSYFFINPCGSGRGLAPARAGIFSKNYFG